MDGQEEGMDEQKGLSRSEGDGNVQQKLWSVELQIAGYCRWMEDGYER